MTTPADIVKMIKEKDVKFVDFRFSDTRGKLQHVTADANCIDEDLLAEGYAFDGSSIAGWKGIEASDMLLMADPESAHIDPFFAQKTLAVFCDVVEPSTGELYERDPRGTAKKAEAYMKSTGVGDTVFFVTGSRILPVRRREVPGRPLRLVLQARLLRAADQLGPQLRDGPTSATVRASRAATSRSPRSTAARTSAPKCSR